MISQNMIDLLISKSDRMDEVVFYCGEVFSYIDMEENAIETDNGETKFEEITDDDFTFYTAEELEMKDNIFEFVKDLKKAQKSVSVLEKYPKTLTLFMRNETLMTTEEAMEDLESMSEFSEMIVSLWELKLNKKPKI
jgi:cell fate (sporulation/competence/biofilm development) regulator YmcA (YheA/YmcA/DUF963 family)